MEKSKSLIAVLIVALIKSAKFLPKILGVLIKTLKGAGAAKIGLGIASFGAYSVLVDWRFAVSVLLLIGIHESGHVWAMRKMGMATRGFYFIPLLGGAAVPETAFPSRWTEGYVAIMGPLWGLVITLATFGLFLLTGNLVFEVAACWMAFVNLLNLIPVYPLDGGRVIKSLILSLGGIFGFVLFLIPIAIGMAFCALHGYWLFFGFGFIGLWEQFGERMRKRRYFTKHDQCCRASLDQFIETLAKAFNLPNNFAVISERIKRLCDGPDFKKDFVFLRKNEKIFQQLNKEWERIRKKWKKFYRSYLPDIYYIPYSTTIGPFNYFLAGERAADREIKFRSINIAEFFYDFKAVLTEGRKIMPDKKVSQEIKIRSINKINADFKAVLAEARKFMPDKEVDELEYFKDKFEANIEEGELVFSRLCQNIISRFFTNEPLSDYQKKETAEFLIHFQITPKVQREFTDFYLQNRDEKDIALTFSKSVYLLFAYLLLVGIFFFLMKFTGGHEAAEGAVKFFQEF